MILDEKFFGRVSERRAITEETVSPSFKRGRALHIEKIAPPHVGVAGTSRARYQEGGGRQLTEGIEQRVRRHMKICVAKSTRQRRDH